MVVSLLVPAGAPVDVAVDDTLFKRRGKKVWAASWFHDGSAQGPAKTGYGNNWVILAVTVRLQTLGRLAPDSLEKEEIKNGLMNAEERLRRSVAELASQDGVAVADGHGSASSLIERYLPDHGGYILYALLSSAGFIPELRRPHSSTLSRTRR